MAIDETEADLLIAALVEAIPADALQSARHAVGDLISQWRAEIEAGRPVDRKLKVRQSPGLDELVGIARSGTTYTGEFVGKAEYSKFEQLDLLVEALGLVFAAPQMMASRLLDTVRYYRSSQGVGATEPLSIEFAGTGETETPALSIDETIVTQSIKATASLTVLLDEISRVGALKERTFTQRPKAI